MAGGQIIKFNKSQQICVLTIAVATSITFNRPFYSGLRSRRLEVVVARKNERARDHARGERERLPGRPTKNVSCPQSNYLAQLRDLSKILTENE